MFTPLLNKVNSTDKKSIKPYKTKGEHKRSKCYKKPHKKNTLTVFPINKQTSRKTAKNDNIKTRKNKRFGPSVKITIKNIIRYA